MVKRRPELQRSKQRLYLRPQARVAQLVEHDLAKVGVAGSSPVFRSLVRMAELVDALL